MPFETVQRMIERRANIRWRCDVGQGHHGDVDLKRVAKAKGGDYSIVNRRPSCRIPGCPGVVIFEDFSGSWPRKVETITDRDPAWWEENERRRAELMALGYRMEMGKWVAPKVGDDGVAQSGGPPLQQPPLRLDSARKP
ncbi:hypothetical protein ACWIDJ_17195 [Brevundimonas naejangsanensis]